MSVVPFGNEVVLIDNCATTVIDSDFVELCGLAALSVTRTTKLNVPAADGVPKNSPVLDKASPPGSDPATKVHVYGGGAPNACRLLLGYTAPTTPAWGGEGAVVQLLGARGVAKHARMQKMPSI